MLGPAGGSGAGWGWGSGWAARTSRGGKRDAGRVLPVTGAGAVRACPRPLRLDPTISCGDHAGPAANYPGTLQADSSDGLHMIHIRPPRRRTRVGWSAVAAAGSV